MEQGMYLLSHTGSHAQHMQPTTLCVGVMENITNNYKCKEQPDSARQVTGLLTLSRNGLQLYDHHYHHYCYNTYL